MLDKQKEVSGAMSCATDPLLAKTPIIVSFVVPLIAALCGIGLAFLIFPAELLLSAPSYWDHVEGDASANLTGYLAFARDDWRWPLFKTALLFPPGGVNILFADPIPLLALLGKIAFKTTGWLPLYFGPWLLASYALQPVAGYFLLRALDFTKLPALVGGLLFLVAPLFIFRYGHFPLVSHWLLLAALLIYVKITRGDKSYVAIGAGFTLLLILINPYLLAMVAAIYAAALCDAVALRKLPLRAALVALTTTAASVVACALLFGFITWGKSAPVTGGFGLYSLNLLSPVWPQLSLFAKNPAFILDPTGGQYEGFAYFGGGLLLFLLMAALFAHEKLRMFFRRSPALFAIALGLAIYALSSRIYAGHWFIGTLPYEIFPPLAKFSQMFRSSGRFFWPLAYLLILAGAAALHARLGAARFAALALAALVVQLADIRPLLSWVSARAAVGADAIDRDKWKAALLQHDELLILPRKSCTDTAPDQELNLLAPLAAGLAIPSSSAYVNRPDNDCGADSQAFGKDLRALATRRNPLILAIKNGVGQTWFDWARRRAGVACRDAGFAYVCSATPGAALMALGSELQPPPKLQVGETVRIQQGREALNFLGYGWSAPVQDAVWGVGAETALMARMSEQICGDAVFRASVTPFVAGAHRVDRARVTINGGAPTDYALQTMARTDIEIPFPQAGCSDWFEIRFNFSDLKSPKELGVNLDPRPVNWMLHSFSIDKRS